MPSKSVVALYIFANISPDWKQLLGSMTWMVNAWEFHPPVHPPWYSELPCGTLHYRRTAGHRHYIPSENCPDFLPIPRISALSARSWRWRTPDAAVLCTEACPWAHDWIQGGQVINQTRLSDQPILGLWLSLIVQFLQLCHQHGLSSRTSTIKKRHSVEACNHYRQHNQLVCS